MIPDPNLAMLERDAEALGPLRHRMVFLGGRATGLLITNPAAAPIRATRDVDVIVGTPDRSAYFALEKSMTERGFRHDQSAGAPICRWTFGETLLDVMPIDSCFSDFALSHGQARRRGRSASRRQQEPRRESDRALEHRSGHGLRCPTTRSSGDGSSPRSTHSRVSSASFGTRPIESPLPSSRSSRPGSSFPV